MMDRGVGRRDPLNVVTGMHLQREG
jgi:hypothetical protein